MANIMIRCRKWRAVVLSAQARPGSVHRIHRIRHPGKWGGELKLDNGGSYYIDPIAKPPRLPISLRAKRLGAAED